MSFTLAKFIAIGAIIGSAFAESADPVALATVKQQFINAKIVPDVIPSFNPIALLHPTFASGLATVGEPESQTNVSTKPEIHIAGTVSSTAKFTLLMIDGNYVGSTNPQGLNLHYLQNNVVIGSDGMANNATSAATIPYAGPAPPSGTGPHRYTILLFQQPANFTAPSTPAANSGVHFFNLTTYTTAAGFSTPLAGSYFTVEVGTATVQVGATTAVNPSTISVASSTSSGTGSPTGAGASPSATHSAAAGKLSAAAAGGSFMGLMGMVALLM